MAKTLLPVYLILPVVALFGRIIQFFESDSVIYTIVSSSSYIFFGIAVFAAIFLTSIFAVVRFYKNLFSGEGYLSFTLPVTPTQHLLVKSGTALCFMGFTFGAILLSVGIFTAGEVFSEILKAIGYLAVTFTDMMGIHLWLYVAEFILLLILAYLSELFIFYGCISIGQTFRKNRVLGAVGVYFIYYFISQTVGTVLMVIFSAFGDLIPFEKIFNWVALHPYASVHIFFGFMLLVIAVMIIIAFAISKFIITKKLNLE